MSFRRKAIIDLVKIDILNDLIILHIEDKGTITLYLCSKGLMEGLTFSLQNHCILL